MTANRWWVRMGARWFARVDGVSGLMRLAMLGLTGVSTMSITLHQYGYGRFALPLIVLLAVGTVVFTYLYTEGGVWNQVRRDTKDLSQNYSTPHMKIANYMTACAFYAGKKGEPLTEAERDAVREEIDVVFAETRDGVSIEEAD